jgi:transketolase
VKQILLGSERETAFQVDDLAIKHARLPGSEVQIAVEARNVLPPRGIGTRVVPVPCLVWFEA